jgi:hypothetical protein
LPAFNEGKFLSKSLPGAGTTQGPHIAIAGVAQQLAEHTQAGSQGLSKIPVAFCSCDDSSPGIDTPSGLYSPPCRGDAAARAPLVIVIHALPVNESEKIPFPSLGTLRAAALLCRHLPHLLYITALYYVNTRQVQAKASR